MSEPARGLPPRPEPDPLVLALVSAAVEQLTAGAGAGSAGPAGHEAWRFSGRWWMKPSTLRRERPWVRG